MMPEELIDRMILETMTQFGADMVDDIQFEVNILYPPASVPYEPPHRRTGRLHDEITFNIAQQGPITNLMVISGAPYSARLEGPMRRFFMGPAQEKWTPILFQRLAEKFSAPV